jgi:hypothetical protein
VKFASFVVLTALDLVLAWSLLGACGGSSALSLADQANVTSAAQLSAMGYRHQDAATLGAALDRGAYCAATKVLRDHHLPLPTVDAGITCNNGN